MTVTSATQTQYTQATNKTTATKATSAYETVAPSQTQQTDKMAEMKEKYKDIYTPIPETYSKSDEDLQTQKIHEAYPNYISFPDMLKIFDKYYKELGGEPAKLGAAPSQEQMQKIKEVSEKAFHKAYEEIGHTEESFRKMEQDVQEIREKYPINDWAKNDVPNAKELARFDNAVVYEGLESGKTLEEAKIYAGSIRETYMSITGMPDTFLDTLVKAGRADPNSKPTDPDAFKPNFDATNNTIWDLRQYGIEGDWTKNSIYNNDTAMISELEKKMGEFNFMLSNENLMKEANSKLNTYDRSLGQENHYKEYINNEYLPETKFALDIFKNYKIYDSIDVRG
jgi:hypothetical protein